MAKKTKVAFVNQPLDHVLPPHQNSIGIWTYQVARRITEECDVTCYAKLMQGETGKVEYDGDVRYQFVRMAPIRAWDKMGDFLSRFYTTEKPLFAAGFYFLDFILPIALDVRRKKHDVVHIHNFTQFVPVVRALNPAVKIVLHMNGEWLSQLDANLMASRIDKADLILGSSDHIRDLVRKRFPQFAHKIETVYNGVDTDHFVPKLVTNNYQNGLGSKSHTEHGGELIADTTIQVGEPSDVAASATTSAPAMDGTANGLAAEEPGCPSKADNEPVLLFVGRISPEKGLHVLMDAFAIVGNQHPTVTLQVVGPEGEIAYEYLVGLSNDPQVAALAEFYIGEHAHLGYLDHLRQRVPAELRDRVIFIGPIAQKQLIEQYLSADILVNPSFSESFGMSLAEAMACAKPVVASRVGGMKSIVENGKTGHLVDQGNPQALADALLDLLNHPEKRKRMGEAGRSRSVALFSWDQVGKDWLSLIGKKRG